MIKTVRKLERKNCILMLFLCFFFGTICYVDMNKLIYMMDSDTVAEINYMQRVWQTKSLLPEGWFHSQELLFSRPVFISSLIYGATNNLLLSYKISLILCCIICIYMFYIYCKSIGFSFQTRLLSILLFLSLYPGNIISQSPTVLGVLFIDKYSYILFLAIIFGTLAIRNQIKEDNRICGYFKLEKLISIVCACYIGLSGVKELIFFYFPWVLLELFSCIDFNKIKIKYSRTFWFSIYNLISNLLGVFIMSKIIAPKINFVDRNNYIITTSANLFDSFIRQVSVLLEVNGLGGGCSLKTLDGLTYLIYFIILIAVMWYFINIILLNKNRVSNSDIKLFNLRYWALSTFGIFFYLTITGTISSGRYYTCYFVLCILVCTILFECLSNKTSVSSKILFGCLCAFLILQWTTFYMPWAFYAKEGSKYNLSKITLAKTLLNDGYKKVYASYWNASILKGITNGQIETAHFFGQNNLQPFEWLIDGNSFSRLNDAVLVLTSDENESFKKNDSMKHVVSSSRFIKKIGEFYVYKFYPRDLGITLSTLPQNNNQVKEIPLPNPSMRVIKETSIKENGIEIKGLKEDKFVLYGPYVDIPSGTYNISFYYDFNGEENNVGYFDVTTLGGNKTLKRINYEVGNNKKCMLDNIRFDRDKQVEFRAFQHKDTDLVIKKMEIQKIQ